MLKYQSSPSSKYFEYRIKYKIIKQTTLYVKPLASSLHSESNMYNYINNWKLQVAILLQLVYTSINQKENLDNELLLSGR